ncbi:MAG TPA: hypothetical protein VLJ41_06550, partial [Segetibacter sp.]|nr:hypothetical protein [Segetibacter sp.]
IVVECSLKQIKVKSGEGTGLLRIKSKTKPKGNAVIIAKGNNVFEMTIEKDKEYVVYYNAVTTK